jgi:hypothetical protein
MVQGRTGLKTHLSNLKVPGTLANGLKDEGVSLALAELGGPVRRRPIIQNPAQARVTPASPPLAQAPQAEGEQAVLGEIGTGAAWGRRASQAFSGDLGANAHGKPGSQGEAHQ